MRTNPVGPNDLATVIPVPPLARRRSKDGTRPLDFDQNNRIVSHLAGAGIRALIYGGNAFLYHLTLGEYGELLDWLSSIDDALWAIPSAGPSFGRAIDQAPMLASHAFPAVMMLPCADPRDAAGLERGYREFADAAGMPLIVYLKDESNFGADRVAGLDAVARLVADGVCIGIKYAVTRQDPASDPYLRALLERVDRRFVISGIGERPAIVHMQQWGLPGFTTGSGCIAPASSLSIHRACVEGRYHDAEAVRERFLPLEDLRDAWGPARVLHAATVVAGIAETGPTPPYVSELDASQVKALGSAVQTLASVVATPA